VNVVLDRQEPNLNPSNLWRRSSGANQLMHVVHRTHTKLNSEILTYDATGIATGVEWTVTTCKFRKETVMSSNVTFFRIRLTC